MSSPSSELALLHQLLVEVELSQFATKIIEDLQVVNIVQIVAFFKANLCFLRAYRSPEYPILIMSPQKILWVLVWESQQQGGFWIQSRKKREHLKRK